MHPALAIYHDYFAIRGGGERLVLTLARELPDAHLVAGYVTGDTYGPEAFPQAFRDLRLGRILHGHLAHLPVLAARFAWERRSAATYPLRIFSGVAAPLAAPRGGGRNILYCHTPPRFLYDQRGHYLGRLRGLSGVSAGLALRAYRHAYENAVGRMHTIIVNSQTTRRRVETYLRRDSVVVHPPVDTGRFRWIDQSDYYLSTARLTPLKRVDDIVKAFLRMPDKKLIVASGGEELARLRAMALGAGNIRFCGWVDDAQLCALVGRAIATIYMARDEDFGMSPVESMAAGKPVIGVAEGGLAETVVAGRTGTLLPSAYAVDDIVAAVRSMSARRARSMRRACEQRARGFTTEVFLERMRSILARQ